MMPRVVCWLAAAIGSLAIWGQNTGVVEGRVVETGSGRPVPGATVTYLSGSSEVTQVADGAGRFRFDRLPAEPVVFRAAHPSAASQSLSPLLTLAPGEHLTGYTVKVALLGSLRGRVSDESGQPIRGCDVSMFSRRRDLDGPDLDDVERASQTNERGEYEIRELEPGRYLLWVSCSGVRPIPSEKAGMVLRYPEVYYPADPGRGAHAALEIKSGQALDHVDVTVSAVPAAAVSMTFALGEGEKFTGSLAPASWSGATRWLLGDTISPQIGSAVVSRYLPQGEYLREGKIEGPGAPRFVHQTVSVPRAGPGEGCARVLVRAETFAGVAVSGRIDWNRHPPERPYRPSPPPMPNVMVLDDTPRLSLADIPLDAVASPFAGESVVIDEHDQFRLPPLPPGRYLMRFIQAFDDYYYVESLVQGTRLVDGPIVTVTAESAGQPVVIRAGWMPELTLDGRALSSKHLVAVIPAHEDWRELQTSEELPPQGMAAVRVRPGRYRVVLAGYLGADVPRYRAPEEALGQWVTVPEEGSARLSLEPSRQLQGDEVEEVKP